ncbi:unnamed protein product [Orchesella dallaii]|uniref:Helicase ATP-binding domain-containing protein n=1 Tax=Orchesella dallaii TaxID=48710 RepID=A0ABP1PZC3_9HEXA
MISSLLTSLRKITIGENGGAEEQRNESDTEEEEAMNPAIEIPMVNAGMIAKRAPLSQSSCINTCDGEENQDEVQKMHATGVITSLDPSSVKGVISHQYLFDIRKFCSNNSAFQRGCKVEIEAERPLNGTQWEVTAMKLYESDVEKINRERRRFKRVTAIVKSVREDFIDVEAGKDKNSPRMIQVPLSVVTKMKSGFHWMPGDWMQLHMENLWFEDETVNEFDVPADITRAKVLDIGALQTKTIVGKVTKRHHNFLIDDSIYFTQAVCKSKQLMSLGTPVRCVAIESNQQLGGNDSVKWRAIRVEKSSFLHYTSKDVVTAANDEWIDDESNVVDSHDELLKNKEGVSISPNSIRFSPINIGHSGAKIITISNNSEQVVRLLRIIGHQDPSVCTFDFNIPDKQPDGSVTIFPQTELSVDLVCHPLLIGKTKELCVFEFGNFRIGRTITLIGRSEEENRLTVNEIGIERPSYKKQHGEQDISKIILDKDRRRVRGSQNVRAPFFCQKRLPLNKVPNEMWDILKNEDVERLEQLYPNAMHPLTYENYKQKFAVSLWFEEMENDIRRRQYDLKNVVLSKLASGCGYSFRVKGIHEFQPPVNTSDAIDAFDPENPLSVKYQGTITKITADNLVHCVFGEAFNVQYTGYPLTIQFCLSRTSYKRCHFAIETAFDYLGDKFLFPQSEVTVEPPRIYILEGDAIDDGVNSVQSEEPSTTNVSTPSIFRKTLQSMPMTMTLSESSSSSSLGEVAGKRVNSLRSKFVSDTPSKPSCSKHKIDWFNKSLNEEQRDAVRRILRGQARPLPYIIYGPPGTGKTVTLVEAIMQVNKLDTHSRVLVCAPSNAAADIIAEYLANSNQYQVGNFVRLNGFLRAQTVTGSIVPFCTDGEDLAFVAQNRLVISTCMTAGQFFSLDLSEGHFTHVFIDEAGYCTEPETMVAAVLLALKKGGQLILAGDPNQLGPVLMSDVAQNCGLNRSFLERLMTRKLYQRDVDRFPKEKHNPLVVTKLIKNYRAHPTLLKLPSRLFYDDDLLSKASFDEAYALCQNPKLKHVLVSDGVPLIFHGVQGQCIRERDSPSWCNKAEAVQVVHYVVALVKQCGLKYDDIGIITPYRKQVEKIRLALQMSLVDNDTPKVASVEEFQGGERKVIIISTVRSVNENKVDKSLERLGFLYQPKRFNVVITRAKALMIVVGNPHVLSKNNYWQQLLRYSIELKAYKGCNLPVKLDPAIRKIVINEDVELPSAEIEASMGQADTLNSVNVSETEESSGHGQKLPSVNEF